MKTNISVSFLILIKKMRTDSHFFAYIFEFFLFTHRVVFVFGISNFKPHSSSSSASSTSSRQLIHLHHLFCTCHIFVFLPFTYFAFFFAGGPLQTNVKQQLSAVMNLYMRDMIKIKRKPATYTIKSNKAKQW